jgi:hypothetical protein
LPLAARDNNTRVCICPLHTMAGKRNLPLLDLDTNSLFPSYYYLIPGSSNAPATTLLPCRLRYVTIGLQMLFSCRLHYAATIRLQIAICHNRIAATSLAQWWWSKCLTRVGGILTKESLREVCHTCGLAM